MSQPLLTPARCLAIAIGALLSTAPGVRAVRAEVVAVAGADADAVARASADAFAEAPADAGAGARLLDGVQVTATRRQAAVLDVPPAVTVVDAEQLRRRLGLTVTDHLRGQPGTFVQQTTPGQGTVIIRGLKGSEVLHTVDGFRLNNAFFRNAPNQYIALVDPLALDRIEVVRGPMATRYGADAMGGVVQFLSWRPEFEGEHWQQQGGLRLRAASADGVVQWRLFEAIGHEDLHLAAGHSRQSVERRRVGGGERLPLSGYRQQSSDLALTHLRGDHHLRLLWQRSEQPDTPRHDALVPGFGQTAAESAEQFFRPQRRQHEQLLYRFDAPLPFADSIELQLGRQHMVDDRVSRDTGSVQRDIEANASTLKGFSAQFGRVIGESHHLGYGIEAYSDRVHSARRRQNIETGAVSPRSGRFPDGSQMRSQALYLANEWRPRAGLELDAGLRYSRFEIRLPTTVDAPGVSLRPDDLSGHLGAVFEVGDGLRVVGNFGRGFRPPNVFDLGQFGERPGNRFSIPNPALRPETVQTLDMGLKLARGPWQGEWMLFQSRYRDRISSVLTGDRTPEGRLVVQAQNIVELSLRGAEAGLGFDDGGEFAARVSLTWTRGDERLQGLQTPADRIPPLFGSASASWRISPRTELEAWSQFAGRQGRLSPRDVLDPRINPEGTPGWATFNLRLGYQPSPAIELALALHNLGDIRYREHGSGLDAPGRDLALSFDWRW